MSAKHFTTSFLFVLISLVYSQLGFFTLRWEQVQPIRNIMMPERSLFTQEWIMDQTTQRLINQQSHVQTPDSSPQTYAALQHLSVQGFGLYSLQLYHCGPLSCHLFGCSRQLLPAKYLLSIHFYICSVGLHLCSLFFFFMLYFYIHVYTLIFYSNTTISSQDQHSPSIQNS